MIFILSLNGKIVGAFQSSEDAEFWKDKYKMESPNNIVNLQVVPFH